jgi:hypothetical protein
MQTYDVLGNVKKRTLENVDVNGRIILKMILNKLKVMTWTALYS